MIDENHNRAGQQRIDPIQPRSCDDRASKGKNEKENAQAAQEEQEEVSQTSPSQLLEGDLTYEHQGGKRRALGSLAVDQM